MEYRTFGRTGWQVGEIGYGMWGMGDWTGSDDEQSLQSLQLAVDLGCNFFDTAYAYGEGHSERLMGLRFILSHPAVSTTIPGMRKPEHVADNIGVSDGKGLPEDLIAQLHRHRWDREPTAWSQ